MADYTLFVATQNGITIGAVGLQPAGDYGLPRSLVVTPEYRGLCKGVLNEAKRPNIESVILLTATPEGFFKRFGFTAADRLVFESPSK